MFTLRYKVEGSQPFMPTLCVSFPVTKTFKSEIVNKGIKKTVSGKAVDATYISSELLKWTMPHTHHWIMTIIEQAIKQGFPNDWLMNWIKPIFKAGDKNQVSNYRTIMVSSTIAKLYSTIMEQKISTWAESTSKTAVGQAGFRPKYSHVDHLVTLKVIMEESRLQGKTCRSMCVRYTINCSKLDS